MAVELIVDTGKALRTLEAFEQALIACREAEALASDRLGDLETERAPMSELAAARQNLADWQRTRAALERLHAAITTGEPA